MLNHLGSTANIIGGREGELYDHLMSTKIFTLLMTKIHMSSKHYEECGYGLHSDLLTILY